MQLPKFKKQSLCLILAAVLMLTGTIVTGQFQAGAASYQSQIADLEAKQAQLKEKINKLQDDIDEQEALKATLQDQIDIVQEQIDLYNKQMSEIQDKIDDMDETIAQKEQQIADKKEMFLARVRAMYIAGNDSALSVLLGADDFADYLYQDELLASITEYDNTVMDELRADIEEINTIKADMKIQKDEILSLRSVVDAKQAELGNIMKQYDSVIAKLESQQSELEIDVEAYQEEIEALEQKIQEAADAAKDEAYEEEIVYSGANFRWPCPNYYYISSNYGYRWGRLHKGTDIAGSNIYGKPIVAAADGVVSLVDYNEGGYGYYVMVNHGNSSDGNNYVTLYAHMSDQAAYEGQHVKAGDTIGYVGNTGRSTGPHLHFEIRVNGTAQNPMNFFSSVG